MSTRILAWTVAVLLTAMYVFALVVPVGNLLYLPRLGFGVSPLGWVLLIAGALLPVAVFLLAAWIPRRRSAGQRLLVLVTGLAVVGLLQLEQTLLVPTTFVFT